MIAMLLAAGRGERLRPTTDELPKALIEVRGRSLLERNLDALKTAGVDTVVINLGWLGEKIAERVASGSSYGLNIVYSREGDDILETGGGIFRALPLLGREPFVVVNADIYTDMAFPTQILRPDALGQLVLVARPEYKPIGDFDLAAGLVSNGGSPEFTFSGVAIYRPELFADCEPGRFPLAPLLRQAADAGQLSGTLHMGEWADVGTAERLAALNRNRD